MSPGTCRPGASRRWARTTARRCWRTRWRSNSSMRSRSATWPSGACSTCRGASGRGCCSRACSSPARRCSSPTSRPPASIPETQFLALMRLRERASAGAAVVVTLHDLTLAARFCDRVVVVASWAGRRRSATRPRRSRRSSWPGVRARRRARRNRGRPGAGGAALRNDKGRALRRGPRRRVALEAIPNASRSPLELRSQRPNSS